MNLERRPTLAVCTLSLALAVGLAACEERATTTSGLPEVDTLVDMALRTARVDDRVVLVKFRASWCDWCARLDQALHSFELGRLIDNNYVLVDVTVEESDDKLALETPGGMDFLEDMGGAGGGIPFYVFLDSARGKIADSNVMPDAGNIGYPVSDEEIAAFGDLLRRTAPRMTAEELDRVASYLAAHGP